MREKPAIRCSGERIPASAYGVFREILEACNGKLLTVWTSKHNATTMVSFSFDDMDNYVEWSKRWSLHTTSISEKRKDSGWRCFMRRNGLGFIERRIGD